jgi:hypothetical protein
LNSSLRLALNNSYPSFELAEHIYLAFYATERSHLSSDRTKGPIKVERIGNGSGAAQITTSECNFYSTGMRGLPRRTSRDLVADFIFACDSCAKRIATVLWQGRQGRVVCRREFLLCSRNETVGPLISNYVPNGQRKAGSMKLAKRTLSFLAVTTVVLLVTETNFGRSVQARTPVQSSTTDASDTSQDKIARAMSAGPDEIARSARIIDTDAEGNTVVLRDGGNGFTCMPGNPKVIGEPPMCVDAASLQWFADAKAHKPKPTNTIPGITYMLAGATQRSDSDPNDKTSPAITVGPHWMIMWPFDPKTTGLPTTHKPTGAYIMWAGSPYAHVHIMGRP